jgi:hypothetical protein
MLDGPLACDMLDAMSTRTVRQLFALALTALASACSGGAAFSRLANEFALTSLSFAPNAATQVGLHRYVVPQTRDTLRLDAMLDDFTPAALQRQRAFYRDFQSLEYADTATRAAHLSARLAQVPAFMATALGNIKGSNETWRKVAIEEASGVADMIRDLGTRFVRGTPSEKAYAAAVPAALAAVDGYVAFVRDRLPHLEQVDWRMGPERFATKWRYYLESDITPRDMLRMSEDSMRTIRRQMLTLAQPLHDTWFAGYRHAAADSTKYLNAVVGEVLARVGDEHANRDSMVVQARKDVAAIGAFVRDQRVLSLTDFSNVRVIPTPVFMRGIYGVAGAVFAPALEPKLSSFYWVTPIPPEWPAARAEAKLREYNRYKMLALTVHEAIPGHLVQGEYANRVTPEWRRLLRAVYGNGAYVEGWAVYAEHVMEQAGLNGGDAVKTRLTALKAMLRIYSNVIIDVRLHTMGLPTDSVVPFLVREAFQEEPEATAKLQRAQLDYVQLNQYPVGLHEWWSLRREAEKREGSAFNLCRFHDTVLSYGSLPVPVVARLYLERDKPTANMPPSRCEKGRP